MNPIPNPLNSAVIPDELLKAYDNQGYVRIPGFLDQTAVEDIRANMKRFIVEELPKLPHSEVFYENKQDRSTLKQIAKIHQWDDYFQRLFLKGRFFDLAEQLMGRAVVGVNLQYFDKPPVIGAPTPPHQDCFYWKITPMEGLTMWLALEAVDEENGCVRYISGSHRQGMRMHGKSGTLGFSQGILDYSAEDRLNEMPISAQAGDLLVHHALAIHRADGNRSATRTRQALGFMYYSARAREDSETINKYQADMLRDMKNEGKI